MIGQYAPGAMLFAAPVDFAPPPSAIVRSPAARARALSAGADFVWCTLAPLADVSLCDPAARAALSCRMFQPPHSKPLDIPSSAAVEFSFGVTKLRSLQQRPDPDHPRAGAATRALRAATLADAALRHALELEGDDPLLEGWIDRITPLAVGEIPAYLLEALPDFTDARLDDVSLSPILRPIAEKRSLGTWCKWIGVLLVPILGLVVVTRDKILRASAAIGEALADRLEFHAYRALCGLLEHLRAVNLRGRNIMHGLYRPHGPDGASRDGPAGIVRCDTLMRGQLKRWQYILTDSCGVSVKRALLRENLEILPSVSLELFSDACYADAATPGVGGYLHGLYWYFAVPASDVPYLSIPILEFLGAAFNVLMFYPHLHQLGSASAPAWVDLNTDAFTTARVLAAESAKSTVIVEAYQHLICSPEWRSLYGRQWISPV